MARWNIDNVPEELDKLVRQVGSQRGENLRAIVLRGMWELMRGVHADATQTPRGDNAAHTQPVQYTREQCHECKKALDLEFVDADKFFEWYDEMGWHRKGSKKPLDLNKAMRRWNRNEQDKQGKNGEQRRLNYAEQRFEDNVRAAGRVLRRMADGGTASAGGDVERTNAGSAAGTVRETPKQLKP